MLRLLMIAGWLCAGCWASLPTFAADSPLQILLDSLPERVEMISGSQTEQLEARAAELDEWASLQWWQEGQPETIVQTVRLLVDLKADVDSAKDRMLQMRIELGQLASETSEDAIVRYYLRSTSALIDLSGRLRARLNDVIRAAAFFLDQHPEQYEQMLQVLIDGRVDIGAIAMAFMLFEPPPDSGYVGFTAAEKYRVLQLINLTHQADLVPTVAQFIRVEENPALVVIAAELLRRLGLPQKPRPGTDPKLPEPAMLAEELAGILNRIDPQRLSDALRETRRDLLTWLDQRRRQGIVGDVYRLGRLELRPGDWLLMRNPSPYNRFTNLSPGLFTHVGVVAVEVGSDGIRRFLIVDLPERGATVPATTVDIYLQRTLHFFFVRHEDAEVGRRMGQAAAAMIDNPAQFDLTFQTHRIRQLRGQPLEDRLIHTYCAGFLLICAQHASRPRDEFFPLVESSAEGYTAANLETMGLSIGEDFVSPTGALFSPRMRIVGRREPMYDPAREVQEAIYDAFAARMISHPLNPSPDLRQALRQQLASLAKDKPWLSRALARVNQVSEQMDLEAAAKAATVIEILDQIVQSNLQEFSAAFSAIMAAPLEGAEQAPMDADQAARIQAYQERHPELVQQWTTRTISARDLRIQLVNHYVRLGQQQLDARFFAE